MKPKTEFTKMYYKLPEQVRQELDAAYAAAHADANDYAIAYAAYKTAHAAPKKKRKMNKLKRLYSEEFRKMAYEMLSKSEFINVYEYKNFVDLELIPFIKRFI